jgi:tetratricopeptide (TPR) repeat protein
MIQPMKKGDLKMDTEIVTAGNGSDSVEVQDMGMSEASDVVEVTFSDEAMLSEIENILNVVTMTEGRASSAYANPHGDVDDNAMKFDMGKDLMEQGYFFQARDIYMDLVKQNHREYESLVRLGTAQRKLGDIADAAASLNRALVLQTENAEAWHQLGMLMLEIERPMLNEAKAFLRQAYRLDPSDDQISASLQRCEMMIKGYTA